MIDAARPLASWFLWIAGALFVVLFALPLFFAPLAWAKRVGWTVPGDVRLARYFGRCLGAVGLALCAVCVRSAPSPSPLLFELVALVAALLAVVHAWGAIERSQPWTETAEIPLFAGVSAVALWIRVGAW
jgi:hypothetical protein